MEHITYVEDQLSILSEGCHEILPADGLREKIESSVAEKRPLRVKLGIDPTTKDVHIGHMVPYRKMRQFQDHGHTAVLIIGDFTAMIGDPSGKHKERPRLSFKEVQKNTETYCSQIFKVIDESKAEIHYQSDWFSKTSLADTLEKGAEFSVNHLLSHETFRSRLDCGERLSLLELFYPVLQAWDSLSVRADVEIGGTDQKFNILCGRDLQRNTGAPPQTALFLPLLPGTDGHKMSKTGGNSINILDSPREMFGKVMSIPDSLIPQYLSLASSLPETPIKDPYRMKKMIAKNIVETYHGSSHAVSARDFFNRTISNRELPEDIPEYEVSTGRYQLIELLTEYGLTPSKSESRRLIQQGGIRVNGERISDIRYELSVEHTSSFIIQAGKRRYIRLVPYCLTS